MTYENMSTRTRSETEAKSNSMIYLGVAPASQPIISNTESNRDLVTRVFPPLRQVTCYDQGFSLAPCYVSFVLIGRCDCLIQVL